MGRPDHIALISEWDNIADRDEAMDSLVDGLLHVKTQEVFISAHRPKSDVTGVVQCGLYIAWG